MYTVTARQLATLALFSALLAGAIVACIKDRPETAKPGSGVVSEIGLQGTVIADPSVATDEQNNVEVYQNVSPGVVNVTSKSFAESWLGIYPQEGSGSGSIISEEGHILTNYHVVSGAQQLEVQIENEKYPATLIGGDPDNDLAVIKVSGARTRLTVVKLGTSKELRVGQKVLAIGNPFGLQRTLTTGIISGLERPLREPGSRRTIEGAIQTDASINPGNSGGPLLNSRGEMIGINTAIYSPSGGSVGIGFAVPVDIAKKIIPDLIAKGYVSYPWLGVTTMPLNRRIATAFSLPIQQGIIVGDVYRGSGAASAGLKGAQVREDFWGNISLERLGDVIVSIDRSPIANAEDLQRALKNKKPGDSVDVEVLRQGARLTVPVRLSERPQNVR